MKHIIQGRIQDFKLGGAHLIFFWGYFVWKITILRQKNHIFSNFRGGRASGAPPSPWIRPCNQCENRQGLVRVGINVRV